MKKEACAHTPRRLPITPVRKGNVPFNLSVKEEIAKSMKVFVAGSRRKGQRTASEITERLWMTYLQSKGVKLPAILKD